MRRVITPKTSISTEKVINMSDTEILSFYDCFPYAFQWKDSEAFKYFTSRVKQIRDRS